MSSTKRLLLIISSLFLVVCHNGCKYQENNPFEEKEAKIKEIKIPDIDKISKIKLSELQVTDIQYIPLETNPNCLLPDIDRYMSKIIANNAGFFINDWLNRRILRFSEDGKFICQIGISGKGPDEYLFITDFSVDVENNRVVILSMLQDQLFLYTLNGEFEKTIECPKHATHIMCVQDNILCYNRNTGSNENSFELLDGDGNILKSYPNRNRFKAGTIVFVRVPNECIFYWSHNILNIKERYIDTIFTFKDKVFSPRMILNRGEKRYSTDLLVYNTEEELTRILMERIPNYIEEGCLFEVGDFIYSEFSFNKSDFVYVASKAGEGEYITISETGLFDDIDGGPLFQLETMKDETTAICWTNAYKLKNHIGTEEFSSFTPINPDKKIRLSELANSLNESDNPVLILLQLRK
ncbi:MAG: 6-bladed beta-propeller [Bacteroidales bacterium]|nr:6-bladed beta-propeller [Bacteroidales bacterium]